MLELHINGIHIQMIAKKKWWWQQRKSGKPNQMILESKEARRAVIWLILRNRCVCCWNCQLNYWGFSLSCALLTHIFSLYHHSSFRIRPRSTGVAPFPVTKLQGCRCSTFGQGCKWSRCLAIWGPSCFLEGNTWLRWHSNLPTESQFQNSWQRTIGLNWENGLFLVSWQDFFDIKYWQAS